MSDEPPERWEVESALLGQRLNLLLADGWEPFAVSEGRVYVRRRRLEDELS